MHALVFAMKGGQLLKRLLVLYTLAGMEMVNLQVGPASNFNEHFVSGRVQVHPSLELKEVSESIRLLNGDKLQLS